MGKGLDRRKFIVTGATAAAGLMVASRLTRTLLARATENVPASISETSLARPPNIIIILTDDLGWGDLGCYGSESIKTPNVDRIASEGVRMTEFFSSAAVCSPSRAGLLTGRYPPRTDVTRVLFPRNSAIDLAYRAFTDMPPGLALDEITIAHALKPSGYATCCIGKWHLGDIEKYRPIHRGFDYYCGLLYSNDMHPLRLYRNDDVIEEDPANQDKLTGTYTREAVEFMRRSASKPFFLYLAHTFPHIPIHASEQFRGKSDGGLYGDAVEEIDWSTGEVLKTVEELGISENTLIFFTSDNGPWFQGSTGGMRGRKSETYDGGMAVPLLARWPGRIGAGKVIKEPAMNIDLFSTSLAAAGVSLPTDRVIDGKDLLPLLSGKADRSPHEAIFFYKVRELQAVRCGPWKYHRRHRPMMAPPLKQWPWLFNIEEDPFESYDASTKYPDVAKRLENLMVEWEKNFGPGKNGR